MVFPRHVSSMGNEGRPVMLHLEIFIDCFIVLQNITLYYHGSRTHLRGIAYICVCECVIVCECALGHRLIITEE